tara:strand:- start:2700 stop:3182 length:483 start_codon:yes stop_codon:yes gene_type:complete
MKIIENFISEKDLQGIQSELQNCNFPWYYDGAIEPDSLETQFSHIFFNRLMQTSNYLHILNPLLEKIPALVYHRIKANLNYRTERVLETGEHVDLDDKRFKSAIFFINDCDGYCRIGDKKIYSKSNRLLIFDSDLVHTGTTTSDSRFRLLINLLYIPVND